MLERIKKEKKKVVFLSIRQGILKNWVEKNQIDVLCYL